MSSHVIKQGECISSIADCYCLHWQDIWNHPDNCRLREQSENPNILLPGDELFIPQRETKTYRGITDQRHCFQVKKNSVLLRLRLTLNGRPIANEPYCLKVDDCLISGQTDTDGFISEKIPVQPRMAILKMVEQNWSIQLALGDLAPANTPLGVAERLRNIGLYSDAAVNNMSPSLQSAIAMFQKEHGLTESQEIDNETVRKLVEMHGC